MARNWKAPAPGTKRGAIVGRHEATWSLVRCSIPGSNSYPAPVSHIDRQQVPPSRLPAAAPGQLGQIKVHDALPVRAVAQRDRTHVQVPRGVQVDPVLTVATAPDCRLGHSRSPTLWLPATLVRALHPF